MRLSFSEHLSAKTHRSYELKVFPGGEPSAFFTGRQEWEGDESHGSTCTYDFPDHSVVVVRTEFGPALVEPGAPVDVTIEVHIGPEASASVVATAEADARKLAAQAGIVEAGDSTSGFSGISIARH